MVQIFIQSGNDEVCIDYLGRGSIIGQFSILGKEKMLFGMRAVVAGGTSLLELSKDTFETMRMKRHEVD